MPQDEILYAIGKLDANVIDIRDRIVRTEAGQEMVRISVEEQGRKIAALPCDDRGRQLSELASGLESERCAAERMRLEFAEYRAIRKWWGNFATTVWNMRAYWLSAIAACAAGAALAMVA